MSKKVILYTLGCRSNQSETAVLRHLFQERGYTLSSGKSQADLAVINTCTVTEKGDQDARKLVHRLCRENPQIQIAMIGCQAQTQPDDLRKLPNVHWIIGNEEKMNLVSLMESLQPVWDRAHVKAGPISQSVFTMPAAASEESRTRANIKIQDGCDRFCAYCEIPFARGGPRSRNFSDIISQAQALAQQGHHELVLTGINIGIYQQGHYRILDVIRAIEHIPQVARVRLSSIEPKTVSDDLVLYMATKTKLCRHLHLPIQSGSNNILAAMGRHYTAQEMELFLEFVSQNIDGVCLGADVIAGFPGETQDDFLETYEFLANNPFAYIHVFSYSDRKFARSRLLAEHVPKSVIQHRSEILRQLATKKKQIFLNSFLGTTHKVLFEAKKKGSWVGLTDNYARIMVQAQDDLHNQIRSVQIEQIQADILCGRLI